MDGFELMLVAGGAGVILLAIILVFVRAAIGGDWRRGNHADTSAGGSVEAGGGEAGGGD